MHFEDFGRFVFFSSFFCSVHIRSLRLSVGFSHRSHSQLPCHHGGSPELLGRLTKGGTFGK